MKYVCSNCNAEFLRWEGRCSSCGQWGTLEEVEEKPVSGSTGLSGSSVGASVASAQFLTAKELGKENKKGLDSIRKLTGFTELDRVLGGGMVDGEVILLSGEPGIGKSTLLLQLALHFAKSGKVLYVSGEESATQLSGRVKRVAGSSTSSSVKSLENLLITTELQVEAVSRLIFEEKPTLVIVDSIQSVTSLAARSYAGSMSQIRAAGQELIRTAKQSGIPVVIVGQVTKEGVVAGPKILEHSVDCVLYLEGDESNLYRILRCIKNRFGSTSEIGVFEMLSQGFVEIANPSQVFLSEESAVSGSVIGAVLSGSRVVMVGVQALVVEHGSSPGPLRRVANGIKKQRLELLCAVLSRRGNCFLGDKDVYVNLVGGLNVDSPVLDLAVCAAIRSALNDKPVEVGQVFIGEVGLTGEVREVYGLDIILKEVSRLGYKKIVCPKSAKGSVKSPSLKVFSAVSEL